MAVSMGPGMRTRRGVARRVVDEAAGAAPADDRFDFSAVGL
ncbi:MAG: hypothetical protein ACQESR_14415 [Planctomycetota bacterium]